MPGELHSIIKRCRAEGLRRTVALEKLLTTLIESSRPMTLAELVESPLLANQCDQATVFRLLQRLADKGILRRLGLHERAAYFHPDHPRRTQRLPDLHPLRIHRAHQGSLPRSRA